ncbi:MAG: MoaD/ThiS family protein [Deltaproteobacteria bacterium]|nr:MoaD/ThiS family protein [Deltaproteobacteria bacterium]
MTIRLTIRLFGTLGLKVPGYDYKKGMSVDLPDGATPEDILKDLQIPLSHIGSISNGKNSLQRDSLLTDGQTINFFPLISGG